MKNVIVFEKIYVYVSAEFNSYNGDGSNFVKTPRGHQEAHAKKAFRIFSSFHSGLGYVHLLRAITVSTSEISKKGKTKDGVMVSPSHSYLEARPPHVPSSMSPSDIKLLMSSGQSTPINIRSPTTGRNVMAGNAPNDLAEFFRAESLSPEQLRAGEAVTLPTDGRRFFGSEVSPAASPLPCLSKAYFCRYRCVPCSFSPTQRAPPPRDFKNTNPNPDPGTHRICHGCVGELEEENVSTVITVADFSPPNDILFVVTCCA
jgi:hypothetical protein